MSSSIYVLIKSNFFNSMQKDANSFYANKFYFYNYKKIFYNNCSNCYKKEDKD